MCVRVRPLSLRAYVRCSPLSLPPAPVTSSTQPAVTAGSSTTNVGPGPVSTTGTPGGQGSTTAVMCSIIFDKAVCESQAGCEHLEGTGINAHCRDKGSRSADAIQALLEDSRGRG